MQFEHILYAISLSANIQKESIYKIMKKTAFLSLAALSINNALAVEARDIKNTNYNNFYTSLAPRTFDYDPSLLPDVAEVIFALRIKQANIDKRLVINLSGNYFLRFTKDRIYILDTYTKNTDIYEYQSTNPNITIGLGVSKGFPSNYKSIVIKEDADGKLYNYAALHSDNIVTDKTILSETLNHPFYQIAGKDRVENKVKVTKAMAFYHVSSHERHARCVKESKSILEQLQDILGFDSGVCKPKANSGIFSASHQSAEAMKLEEKLVEADIESKYHDIVGYELEASLDLNGQDALALVTSALVCKKSIMNEVKRRRERRAPGSGSCFHWVNRLIDLFVSIGLIARDAPEIIDSVRAGHGIPTNYISDEDSSHSEAELLELSDIITQHSSQALEAIEKAAGLAGMATIADEALLPEDATASDAVVQKSVADGKVGVYKLSSEQFRPLPNVVITLNSDLEKQVLDDQQYTTDIIDVDDGNFRNNMAIISPFMQAVQRWRNTFRMMLDSADNDADRQKKRQYYNIADAILHQVNSIGPGSGLIVSVVHHNDFLIGITIGRINGRVYRPMLALVSPKSVFKEKGSYRGAVAFLRSEVLRYLFMKDMIDTSEAYVIYSYIAISFLRIGFIHDEPKHEKPEHDEL